MTGVVVVGDVFTDVVARLQAPAAPGSDTPASVTVAGGGSGANVAWWLAREGTPVALAGRVGDDAPGRERTAELRAAGVRAHLAVDGAHPTGTIVVLVDAGGERSMLTDRGANRALEPGDVPGALLAGAAHLHVSGYTLLDARSRAAALDVLQRAAAAGLTSSVDPSSRAPLSAAGPARFLEWTAGADLAVPNLAEARLLTGGGSAEACARRLGEVYGEAAVTLGAAGAVWSDGRRTRHAAARPVTALDTTGAGDAFTAGFLAAWLQHRGPEAALAAGAALAARAVTVAGARPAL